ncbi:MAG: 6-phosphofructokinase [Armatimonadetes bacterium]|nr:6-phosphofructokinase [Armatimonadota bacterium]
MSLKGNACIGQSGGPSIVINASLVGAVQAAEKSELVDQFFGAANGVSGVMNEKMFDLFREDDEVLKAMRYTPSAALGTCRIKVTEADVARCMEVFKAHNIRYFFYNGGNDSQLTCHQISELAKQSDWDMRVVGIPKTIDNDLVVTDNCPGFASAARYAAAAVQFAARDAMAFGQAEIVEVMGRHAGWLTGATAVGRKEDWMAPHLVYLPEVKVDPDKFLADCEACYKQYGYLVVAVSEGFTFAESQLATTSDKVDEFGHARLGGVAEALGKMVEEAIGTRVRTDKLGNLQRCFAYCMSDVDNEQAYAAGYAAVEKALAGETDIMTTIVRNSDDPYEWEIGTTSLMSVADQTKLVPAEWINADQNGVTEEFIRYVAPLLGKTPPQVPMDIPAYPVFQRHMVEPKLEKYQRAK